MHPVFAALHAISMAMLACFAGLHALAVIHHYRRFRD
jgi:hypothetical protein